MVSLQLLADVLRAPIVDGKNNRFVCLDVANKHVIHARVYPLGIAQTALDKGLSGTTYRPRMPHRSSRFVRALRIIQIRQLDIGQHHVF